MAVDPDLHVRLRRSLGDVEGVVEKRMMGGVCMMVRNHMCCGIGGGGFMIRVGPDAYRRALAEPGVRPLSFGGRAPRGYVVVDPQGLDDAALQAWVRKALSFVAGLPPKN